MSRYENVSKKTKEIAVVRNQRRRFALIMVVLAVFTALAVGFALRYIGYALSHVAYDYNCAIEVHQHTDECYEMDENGAAVLDENGEKVLICGLADYPAHQHNRYCYNSKTGELLCPLKEAKEHVHSDECYRTQQVVICELPELTEEEAAEIEGAVPHKHSNDCYLYKKVLICGQLETQVVHNHDDKCATERELTEAEKARINRAPLDPAKEYSKTYGDDKYVVTVSYMGTAEIPEEAELRVVEVLSDDKNYESIVSEGMQLLGADAEAVNKELSSGNSETVTVGDYQYRVVTSLDIGFYLDGVEIEPKDEVRVSIQKADVSKLTDASSDEDNKTELYVIHKEDASSFVIDAQVDENGEEIDFTATSFSIYTVVEVTDISYRETDLDPEPKLYSGRTLSYNRTRNAFLSDAYSSYRMEDGAFGEVASNFHIVAFDTVTINTHCNGNILAKYLAGNGQNFGTNNYSNELTYIQNFKDTCTGMQIETGNGDKNTGVNNKMVVLGSNPGLKVDDNGNGLLAVNRSDASKVHSNLMSASLKGIIKDIDTDQAPFIDLALVEQEVRQISADLAAESAKNVVIAKGSNGTSNYLITNPAAAGFVSIDASDISAFRTDLHLLGFSDAKNNKGSLIINVDCTGWDKTKELILPTRALVFKDTKYTINENGEYIITSEGTQFSTGEVVEFSGGKVIWNFINSDGIKITAQNMTGAILAPGADIECISNLNGTVIGKNVKINAETHRTDFTGTIVTFDVGFKGTKTLDGGLPQSSYTFNMEEWDKNKGAWVLKETVTSNRTSGKINFPNLHYKYVDETNNQNGTYFFRIYEVKDSTDKKLNYDTRVYVIKVVVDRKNVTKTVYSLTSFNQNDKISTSGQDYKYGDKPLVSNSQIVNEDKLDFNNTTVKGRDFFVQKKWQTKLGVEIPKGSAEYNTLPESVTVNLYRYTGDYQLNPAGGTLVTGSEKTLTRTNDYKASWSELDIQNESGAVYHYYAVETPVSGYKLVPLEIGDSANGSTEVQPYVLTNRVIPKTTSLTVTKEFFVGNDKIDNPLLPNESGHGVILRVLFSTDNGATWNSLNKEWFPDAQCTRTYGDGSRITMSKTASTRLQCDFNLYETDRWSMTITGLPTVGPKSATDKTLSPYIYRVVEKSSDLEAFSYAPGKDFAYNSNFSDKDKAPDYNVAQSYVLKNYADGQLSASLIKKWKLYDGISENESMQYSPPEGSFVDVELYQTKEDDEKGVASTVIAKYRLKMVNNEIVVESLPLASGETGAFATKVTKPWQLEVSGLPRYYAYTTKLKEYSYSFVETACTTDYAEVQEEKVSSNNVTTIVNKDIKSYYLPSTGGKGTILHRIREWLSERF